jgi:hypothetical protein
MSNVAKHDCKQEREGDNGKKAGVDLLVRCNAIRVHDSLKAFREFIRPLERRRRLVCAQLMQDRRYRRAGFLLPAILENQEKPKPKVFAHRGMPQSELNHLNVTCGAPPFRNERLAPSVVVEQIERLIHGLLLAYEVFPAEQALTHCDKLCAAGAASVVQGQLEVFYAHSYLAE